jgi:hypothetical protein
VGVKTSKRLIMDNTDTDRDIDIPKFQRAMLQYCNTLTMPGNMSPAHIVFSRQIRDFIPIKLGQYEPCQTWSESALDRERSMMERHSREIETLTPHKKAPAAEGWGQGLDPKPVGKFTGKVGQIRTGGGCETT